MIEKKEQDKKDEKEHKIYAPINIDISKVEYQKKYNIKGIDIYFPYDAYPPQLEYMEKVISALNKEGSISALESPTGTGKTLCLLCSILAWMRHTGKTKTIYYCTRTVSQINNLLKEINKTCYLLNISFLVSRIHSCIRFNKKTKINFGMDKLNDICEEQKARYCPFYLNNEKCNYDKYNNLVDIEDLFKEGKAKNFCPYFYNIRKTKLHSNLTFMTYNYLLNPKIKNKLELFEEDTVVIFDEAHNICNTIENIYSYKISKLDIENIQRLLKVIVDYIEEKQIRKKEEINDLLCLDKKGIYKEINTIENFLDDIKNVNFDTIGKLYKFDKSYSNNKYYKTHINFFINKFKNFQRNCYKKLYSTFNSLESSIKSKLNYYYKKSHIFDGKTKLSSLIRALYNFFDFLKFLSLFKDIYINSENILQKKFLSSYLNNQDTVEEKETKVTYHDINSFRFILSIECNNLYFDIICLDPSYGLNYFFESKPCCTIFTSGTLSSNLLEESLKIKFDQKFSNKHILNKDQFLIYIITGYQKNNNYYDYDFKFNKRINIQQIYSLGNEILNLVNSVKIGGVLVFFQSFDFLRKCHNVWLENGIINEFESRKKVIFDLTFSKNYTERLINEEKKNNNLLLFTVYRGKNSEGVNFENDEARMVICVGIPFAKLSDIKIKLKREYYDEKNRIEKNCFNGAKWYKEDAIKAVNQSLGRLIRNKYDYGIMICFGLDFSEKNINFSRWIKDNISFCSFIKLRENDTKYYNHLSDFLDNLRAKYSNKIKPYETCKSILTNKKEENDDKNRELDNLDNTDEEYGYYSDESWEKEEEPKETINILNITESNSSFQNDKSNQITFINNKRYRTNYSGRYNIYSNWQNRNNYNKYSSSYFYNDKYYP